MRIIQIFKLIQLLSNCCFEYWLEKWIFIVVLFSIAKFFSVQLLHSVTLFSARKSSLCYSQRWLKNNAQWLWPIEDRGRRENYEYSVWYSGLCRYVYPLTVDHSICYFVIEKKCWNVRFPVTKVSECTLMYIVDLFGNI